MKLSWINPISHYVYNGWLSFFEKHLDLYIYDEKYIKLKFKNHFDLKKYKKFSFHIKTNFINFYKNPINNNEGIKIIGDIFTNTLCLNYLFNDKAIFYTEFFNVKNQSIKRSILSKIILNLFRGKKFIVPTKQSFETISRYTKKVLYFPQIYVGNINNNINISENYINILFVGNLGDWKKNILLILEIADYFKNDDKIKLTLIGGNKEKQGDLFKKYDYLIKSGKVNIIDFIKHEELIEFYKKSDIFLFPSIIDPIGAVILEAMAGGCTIITNKNVGASSYVENNINGFVLQENDKENYIKKINDLINDKNKLLNFKQNSIKLVKEKYWFNNQELLEDKYKEFLNFINN